MHLTAWRSRSELHPPIVGVDKGQDTFKQLFHDCVPYTKSGPTKGAYATRLNYVAEPVYYSPCGSEPRLVHIGSVLRFVASKDEVRGKTIGRIEFQNHSNRPRNLENTAKQHGNVTM